MADLDLRGNTLVVKDIKVNADAPGDAGTSLSAAELTFVDGVTAGTAQASKAMVTNSSNNIASLNDLSMLGDLTVDGVVGTGAATPGLIKLTTPETTIVITDQLGRIDFSAPAEASGTDAILVGASIWAEAGDTFTASVNDTDLVFATGLSEAAAEKARLDSSGVLSTTGGVTTTAGVTAKSGTAVPATAGAVAAGAPITCFSSGWKLWVTSDAPTHSATKGDLCINTGGSSTSTRLYVNNGTTNWIAITTAS